MAVIKNRPVWQHAVRGFVDSTFLKNITEFLNLADYNLIPHGLEYGRYLNDKYATSGTFMTFATHRPTSKLNDIISKVCFFFVYRTPQSKNF